MPTRGKDVELTATEAAALTLAARKLGVDLLPIARRCQSDSRAA